MDRRTFLGLGCGVLGSGIGSVQLYKSMNDGASRRASESELPSSPPVTTDEATENPPAETSHEREARNGSLLLGITPQMADLSRLSALEHWQGHQNATVAVFVNIGLSHNELLTIVDEVLTPIWDHGSVPHIIWQPYLESHEATPATIPQEIAGGRYDRLLDRWADILAQWLQPSKEPNRRLYLNFAPEMNGDWVPWDTSAGETTPTDYVQMYQHVRDQIMKTAVTRDQIQWVWAVNNMGRTSAPIAAFYPGDSYVDWCGIHGYNWSKWGGWNSPAQIYDDALDEIRAITDKPIAISEYGCSSMLNGYNNTKKKGVWIQSVFKYFKQHDIRMALWFNHEKETDWAVFGGSTGTETFSYGGTTYQAYREYRKAVAAEWILPAYPGHPRRLADEEFRGGNSD